MVKKVISLLILVCSVLAIPAFAADNELAKKSTINAILERKELRVGFDAGYMPFEMQDKNGVFIGFDMDLGRELAKAMGVKFVPVNLDFKGLIPALQADKIDVIISGMTITQERNLTIGFSDPYIQIGQTILLNKKHENTISSWEQLNDPKYSIVARRGTTSEIAAKRYLSKATLKSVEKESEGAFEVLNNRCDAWVYDLPFNVVYAAQHGKDKLVHLDTPFTYEPLGIGIRQGDPDFLNFLNTFIRQLKADGRSDRMYEKWIKTTDWFNNVQ